MLDAKHFTFYFAMVVMTVVLLWGLRIVSILLLTKGGEPLMNTILAEEDPDPEEPPKGSFSRTAGAFGAVGMAAATIGIGYWVLYGLFFGSDLTVLRNVGWYFLSGSALFFPYAFNQLARIFSIPAPNTGGGGGGGGGGRTKFVAVRTVELEDEPPPARRRRAS